MKIAILLQHYFPYGGLQRDALRLAQAALEAGDKPTMIVSVWDGEKPPNIPVTELRCGGAENHSKAAKFSLACQPILQSSEYDTAISFSRTPHTPFHFCGDSCFIERFKHSKNAALRLLPRYRYFIKNEQRIFGPTSNSHLFFLSDQEVPAFQKHYQLQNHRLTILPPWLNQPQTLEDPKEDIKKHILDELNLSDNNRLLLFVGSNFKLKGLGTIITSLSRLDPGIHLAICGDDDAKPYKKLADSLNVAHRTHFMGPRDDIPHWMTAADLLVHPSKRETAGMVLVEALTYGLPVTCTETCGYASHVKNAGGTLLKINCSPPELSQVITTMLTQLPSLRENALTWAADPDHYRTADVMLDHMRSSIT